MDKSIIGLIIFFVAHFAGRVISEKALKLLSESEQAKLVTGFSKYRVFSLAGVIVLVAFYYSLQAFAPNSYFATMQVYVGILVLYLLMSSIFAYSKLKKLELPDDYINRFLISTFVQYTGIFVFFWFLLNRN